jgi:hypothetical protein
VSPAPARSGSEPRRVQRTPPHAPGYHRDVLGLVMLVVVALVWLRRRLTRRRASLFAAEEARAEAERLAREQAIIAEMEADFLRS